MRPPEAAIRSVHCYGVPGASFMTAHSRPSLLLVVDLLLQDRGDCSINEPLFSCSLRVCFIPHPSSACVSSLA